MGSQSDAQVIQFEDPIRTKPARQAMENAYRTNPRFVISFLLIDRASGTPVRVGKQGSLCKATLAVSFSQLMRTRELEKAIERLVLPAIQPSKPKSTVPYLYQTVRFAKISVLYRGTAGMLYSYEIRVPAGIPTYADLGRLPELADQVATAVLAAYLLRTTSIAFSEQEVRWLRAQFVQDPIDQTMVPNLRGIDMFQMGRLGPLGLPLQTWHQTLSAPNIEERRLADLLLGWMRMLSSFIIRPRTDIRHGLFPWFVHQLSKSSRALRFRLDPMPTFRDMNRSEDWYAKDTPLFWWNTETSIYEYRGFLCRVPQARYALITDPFLIVSDVHLVPNPPTWDTVWVIWFMYRGERLYTLRVSPAGASGTRYEYNEYLLPEPPQLYSLWQEEPIPCHPSLAMAMGTISQESIFPHQIDPVLRSLPGQASGGIALELPRWMNASSVHVSFQAVPIRQVNLVGARIPLLPSDFDRALVQMLHQLAAIDQHPLRLRIRLASDRLEQVRIDSAIKMMTLAGVNALVISDDRGRVREHTVADFWKTVHVPLMGRVFDRIGAYTPWYVLAWRFIAPTLYSGLRNLFGRYLYELEPTLSLLLFGVRTMMAESSGQIVPFVQSLHGVRYRGSRIARMKVDIPTESVVPIDAKWLGRRTMVQREDVERWLNTDREMMSFLIGMAQAVVETIMER